MASTTITMTAGKEFLEACRVHNRETALSRTTGALVSTMTWDGAQYVFTVTPPEPMSPEPVRFDRGEVIDEDEDDAEGDEDPELQAWRAKAARLDVNDVVCRSLETLMAKDGTPLHHLVEAWQSEPPPDLYRPCVAPHQLEALGKFLVLHLSRAFAAAMAVQED